MSRIYVHGCGAVSPAGWDVHSLIESVREKRTISLKELKRPGWAAPLLVRVVPPASTRPAFLSHPRLRRASAITHYAVSAALEALGAAAAKVNDGSLRLGVIFCVLTGCVNYSRRFYDEAWHDPATASPLLFPETVFNAPSSHLAALLGSQEINYTLVGDPGTFLQGLALAAEWLTHEPLDGCLVVGAEELEWLAVDAYRLSAPKVILSEGAGALYLTRETPREGGIELTAVTDPSLFFSQQSRIGAAEKIQADLHALGPADLLCDGLQGIPKLDAPEQLAWASWAGERISPKTILGEGLMAAAAWQCVVAAEALRRGSHRTAHVSVVGCNEQAIGAQFRSAT
jgi:3-oxoacyl-(acyl-carrier-protein) synthase